MTEETRPRRFVYDGRAEHFSCYGLYDDDVFVCRCGWSGTTKECATEYFESGLQQGECAKCDIHLWLRVVEVTLGEARAAAERGDSRAIRDLPNIERLEAKRQAHLADERRRREEAAERKRQEKRAAYLGDGWPGEG